MNRSPYTPQETSTMKSMYESGQDPVVIGETLNRSTRSVISKLVSLGVYKPAPAPAKRLKRTELLSAICTKLGIPYLASLESCTHNDLTTLWTAVKEHNQ